jgi:DNA (cytosine-5)-methyltransferase 1
VNNKYNNGNINIEELLKREFLVIDTRQSDIRLYNGYIPILRTSRSGVCYVKNGELRKLSGKESLLFQGFPKDKLNKVNDISDIKNL